VLETAKRNKKFYPTHFVSAKLKFCEMADVYMTTPFVAHAIETCHKCKQQAHRIVVSLKSNYANQTLLRVFLCCKCAQFNDQRDSVSHIFTMGPNLTVLLPWLKVVLKQTQSVLAFKAGCNKTKCIAYERFGKANFTLCANCNEKSRFRCSHCNLYRFCSAYCVREDWRKGSSPHRLQCKEIARMDFIRKII